MRTKDGLEIDFVLANEGVVEQIFEVKNADKNLSAALLKFQQKYNLKAIQLVKELRQERVVENIQVIRLNNFLQTLDL